MECFQKMGLYKFPNQLLVCDSSLDGDSIMFTVVAVGYVKVLGKLHHYRLLSGMGYRLEIYNDDDVFVCQFHYEYDYEAYADIMRFCSDQLCFEYNQVGEVVGKIYMWHE